MGEDIFNIYNIVDKGLVSRIYKEYLQINKKKDKTIHLEMGKGYRQSITEEEINKHMKGCSNSPRNLLWKCSHNKIAVAHQICNIREGKHLVLVMMQTKRHLNCCKEHKLYNNFREAFDSTVFQSFFDTIYTVETTVCKIFTKSYPYYTSCLVIFSFLFYYILFYPALSYLSLFHF